MFSTNFLYAITLCYCAVNLQKTAFVSFKKLYFFYSKNREHVLQYVLYANALCGQLEKNVTTSFDKIIVRLRYIRQFSLIPHWNNSMCLKYPLLLKTSSKHNTYFEVIETGLDI